MSGVILFKMLVLGINEMVFNLSSEVLKGYSLFLIYKTNIFVKLLKLNLMPIYETIPLKNVYFSYNLFIQTEIVLRPECVITYLCKLNRLCLELVVLLSEVKTEIILPLITHFGK